MTPATDREKKAARDTPARESGPSPTNEPKGERIRPHTGAARDHTRAAAGSAIKEREAPGVLKVASPLSDFAGFYEAEFGSETLTARPATRPAAPSEVKAKAEALATKPAPPAAPAKSAPVSEPAKATPAPAVQAKEMDFRMLSKNVPIVSTRTEPQAPRESGASAAPKPAPAEPARTKEPVAFIAAPPPSGPSPARPGVTPNVPAPITQMPAPDEPVWEIAYPQGALLLGNISAKGGVLIGPSALMNGAIRAGGPIAIGDHAEVTGRIDARGPITIGVGADLGPVRSTRGLSAAPSEGVELRAMRRAAVPLGPQTAIEARYVGRGTKPKGGNA